MHDETDDRLEATPSGEPGSQSTSRGEFLKWGTMALGGLYVGPKVTSFAVQKTVGQAGSPSPKPTPPSPPGPQIPQLPPTGGAAGQTSSSNASMPTWVPAAGAGAAALGLLVRQQAKAKQEVANVDPEEKS